MQADLIEGIDIIAQALKNNGIKYIFGVVGVPITELAIQCQKKGINFIAMRNEQSAAYAASVGGYLTQHPCVCMTVSGPGMLHGLGGLLNAQTNCWPMILLSSSSRRNQIGMGAFQEAEQLTAARPYTKYAVRCESVENIPLFFSQAVRWATYGRPGPVYIEIPTEIIISKVPRQSIQWVSRPPPPPIAIPSGVDLDAAVQAILKSEKPVVIIGKGAAYGHASDVLNELVSTVGIPFLPSPMGKGVVSDSHPRCVAAARSHVLSQSDLMILVGMRMNWMFNFGDIQRISSKAVIIQIDICAEQIHCNRSADIPLWGDAQSIIRELNQRLIKKLDGKQVCALDSEWWLELKKKEEVNRESVSKKMQQTKNPMGYYRCLSEIQKYIPGDAIVVNEGANTMDIGRVVFTTQLPFHRLDAGTLGVMGVGCGYAIAAALIGTATYVENNSPGEKETNLEATVEGEEIRYIHSSDRPRIQRKVFCIQGDSAFGFSGMEIETACRYKLPITFIVINNNGIYRGMDELPNPPLPTLVSPSVFVPNAQYNKIIESFGGKGYFATNAEELSSALEEAVKILDGPTLITVMIDPMGPIPSIIQGH